MTTNLRLNKIFGTDKISTVSGLNFHVVGLICSKPFTGKEVVPFTLFMTKPAVLT